MIAPLIVRGKVMGTITLAISDSEWSYNTDNLHFAQELAERIALTLDNSNLFHQVNQQRVSLMTILDSITDAVLSVDDQMYIRRANAFALQLLGLSEESISESQVEKVISLTEKDGARAVDVEGAISKCILKAQEISIKDAWLKLSEGHQLPVELTIAPEQTEGQEVQRAVVVLRDVTDRLERDELRNHIVSLVSHELRAPLTHIKGFASTLLATDIKWDEQVVQDMIRTIDREADRLGKLIEDLLDMSRLQSGKIPLQPIKVSPARLVNFGLESSKPYLPDHRLTVDVPDTLPYVMADPSRIEQVIGNLVENPSKYSPRGRTIRIIASSNQNTVMFSVADEGPGIPSQYHQWASAPWNRPWPCHLQSHSGSPRRKNLGE
jgi:PAS domain S-box-containing protein